MKPPENPSRGGPRLTPERDPLKRDPAGDVGDPQSHAVPIGVRIVDNAFDDPAVFRGAAGLSKVIPQMYTGDRFPDFREQK